MQLSKTRLTKITFSTPQPDSKMTFKGAQKTYSHTQINNGTIEQVFPLLCPVREKDWLDGWNYKMIHSDSGIIEKNCVFTTPHHGTFDTVWHVTEHDELNHRIEFVRVTPAENVVKIDIRLKKFGAQQTKVFINYQYTALNEAQCEFINSGLEKSFLETMDWWETAINHYLKTGIKLKKQ